MTDVIVIGAGIAGASAAAELAAHGKVVLLEAEAQPGYHSTGRSAAFFAPGYGNRAVAEITAASEAFLRAPPAGFSDVPLLTARGYLCIARVDQLPALHEAAAKMADGAHLIDTQAALSQVPVLRDDAAAQSLMVSNGGDLEVDALLQGFLRLFKRRGGTLNCNARVRALEHTNGMWKVTTQKDSITAPTVVNAAGAWADAIAGLAGLGQLAIVPKRRTACLIDPPADTDISSWPLVFDVDEQFYFKPDAGKLLLSPADETTVEACDIQPDDLDVATAVERFERATTMDVRHVGARWAGLRSFAPDRTPVAGFDPRAPGFFWLAGQGGYGVQTSPAMAHLAAHLVTGMSLSPAYRRLQAVIDALAPGRLLH